MKDLVKSVLIALVLLVVLLYAWIGAVLQESYKLCPVTEEEMMMEVDYE